MDILFIPSFLVFIMPPIATNRHIQSECLTLLHLICVICVTNCGLKPLVLSFS
jgi:hypothetical protein